MPSTAALALLLALPLCGFASTIAKPDESATINGTIVDDSGQPAKDATVFVYSAHLKSGYAVVCPTCWIDCGKRAVTDAQGQFTITGLNPALNFKLLVVKDGFSATAKGGVDPAQGSLPPIKLSQRTSSPSDSEVVHGRLTDVGGNPIAGALVEPVGATTQPGDIRSFGALPWIDPLAATNASGEFTIVATKPVEKIMLLISPRGLAPKIVTESPGPAANSIVLTEGVTIMGRLVKPNGTPAAHAEVVMVTHANYNGLTFSDMRVGTDKDGSFAFTNVPPGRIWGIYPAIESLQGQNLTAAPHWCETTTDRHVIDVGRLALRPGFTVTGKIELPGQKAIPPGMHVTMNREQATHNRLADIAPDGSFEFTALAPGIYYLAIGINGYQSPENSPQEILVDHDRRDVVIQLARLP
jgi:Carboxypeptidase regulatory-like domain